MSERTTVVFVRHGQTDWNVARRWQGQLDIPLNDAGRRQARAAAHRLRHWALTALYTSDLSRAAETANIIGESIGLTPVPDSRWRERHAGEFQATTRQERLAHFPELAAAFEEDISNAPPGGESLRDLHARVVGALDELVEAHRGEKVGVVCHGGAIRTVVREVLGLPLHRRPNFAIGGNSGLTVIEDGGEWRRLLLLNDTAHLERWRD
jgi:broad specificity phosphatase PhoE